MRPRELWGMKLFHSDRVNNCSLIVAQFTQETSNILRNSTDLCMFEIIVNVAMTIKRVDLAIMIIGVIMM